jgi:nucleoside 2-deoxyribosyltransferase
VTALPPENSHETLVVLVTQRAQFHAFIEAIDKRAGDPRLKEIEKKAAEGEISKIEQNISEILEASESVPISLINLKADVERMNKDVPFDKSVFLMTKFPDKPNESLKDKQLDLLAKAIENALNPYGLFVRRADKRNYASSKQLWDNVRVHMLGCKYGVAILESKYKDEFNPNVALEYGFMNALGREVILLIEKTFKHRRADILGTLGKGFEWSATAKVLSNSVTEAIDSWMIDLGIPKIKK